MANIQNDRSQLAAGGWYMQANRNCFHSLEKGNFLLLFLAPICLPYNKNFGQAKKTSGRASSSQQKKPEQIASQQWALLKDYRAVLETPRENPEIGVVSRARALLDQLKVRLGKADIEYISKGNSCQAHRYLSVFENANLVAEKTAQQMMDYLVELYTLAVKDIFRNLPDYYRIGLEKKTQDVLEKFPHAALPETLPPEQDRLAWLLCCELILLACQEENDWKTATELELLSDIPEEAPPIRSGKAKVHLPVGIFYTLCAKAVDGMKTVEDVTGMLNLIQNFCPLPYDEKVRSLLNQVNSFIEQTQSNLMVQCSKDMKQMSLMLPEINRLEELKNQCNQMLER